MAVRSEWGRVVALVGCVVVGGGYVCAAVVGCGGGQYGRRGGG